MKYEPEKFDFKKNDRLTAVLSLYHQTEGESPLSVRLTMENAINEKVQPYSRRLTIGNDWKPLDLGWVLHPGYLLIENKTAVNSQRIPTPEEVEEVKAAVIEIGIETDRYEKPLFTIIPGSFFLGELAPGSNLVIRCVKGIAKYNLTLISK